MKLKTLKSLSILMLCSLGVSRAQSWPQHQFLPAHLAFSLHVKPARGSVRLLFDIAPGYALYRDAIHVLLSKSEAAHLGTPDFPQGVTKDEPFFGRRVLYESPITVDIPLTCAPGPTALTLTVQYQGCAEAGLCYPPVTKEVHITRTSNICGR